MTAIAERQPVELNLPLGCKVWLTDQLPVGCVHEQLKVDLPDGTIVDISWTTEFDSSGEYRLQVLPREVEWKPIRIRIRTLPVLVMYVERIAWNHRNKA